MIGTVAPNIFDRLAMAFGRASKALPTPGDLYRNAGQVQTFPLVFPGWQQYEEQGRGYNAQDEQRAKQAVQSAWVFADVQAIANEASAADLRAILENDEDDPKHPLVRLWSAPNPHMGRSFVMSMWCWSYVLTGKAYLYWVPGGGQIQEVWPIPSFMITPVPDAKKFIRGYAFRSRPDADPTLIPAEYITYSHSVNPFDVRDGMSFLVAAMVAIKADISAAQWNLNFFSANNGVPDGLISVKQETLDSDLARIRMELRDFFGGTRRGVAVARAGDMDYKPFGRTQKDAEFITGRQFSRSEIDRALGFPEGYWSETANRANAEQARATMISGAVWPLLVRLHEDLNAQLIPRWFSGIRVEFQDIRPQDRQLKLAEFAAYQAVLTVDELRKMIDHPPLGDVRGMMLPGEIAKGTPIPTSDPSAIMEDTLSEMETDAPAAPPEDAETPPEEEAPPPDEQAKALEQWQRKAIKALKVRGRAAVGFASADIAPETHEAITTALKSAQTPDEVRAAFAPFAVKRADARTLAAILRAAEQRALDAIQAGETPDLTRLEAELRAALQAELVAEVLAGIATQGAALGVTPDSTALAQQWAASYVPGAVRDMTDTTRAGLDAAIQQYRTLPMTRAQLIDVIGGLFSPERAAMIADTEATRANSQATVEINRYLRAAGLAYVYQWLTTTDERVCPICGPKADTIVPETDLPPAHPRCRCRAVNVPKQ